MLNVTFVNKRLPSHPATVIFIDQQLNSNSSTALLDQSAQQLVAKIIENKPLFSGKFGQVKLLTINAGSDVQHLILIGLGQALELTEALIEELGGKILSSGREVGAKNIGVNLTGPLGNIDQNTSAALIASGAILASYKFDKYFTQQPAENKFAVASIEILTASIITAETLLAAKQAVISGVFFARDCVSEPPNILYPESYAEKIVQSLEPLGVNVEILGERVMKNLGMGAILGVGRGSHHESQLVVMKYTGAHKDSPFVAFVGKGVTFDTGGISLKPSSSMADMKYDMAGSAAVVGAIEALARRGAKVNVVGVVGLVENMPGGNAQRPGDVVMTMSGQTVEVLDTDAEGRLVLADALWYVQEKFQLQCVIDLATLTGAVVVALGNSYAGLFSNNDQLAGQLLQSGLVVNEKLWRLPMHKDFDEMIKSEIADIANLGNLRGAAGSSTAAHFIGRFIKQEVIWAHIDMAGMAWTKTNKAICPKGAVGYGVRLLNQLVCDHYENQ